MNTANKPPTRSIIQHQLGIARWRLTVYRRVLHTNRNRAAIIHRHMRAEIAFLPRINQCTILVHASLNVRDEEAFGSQVPLRIATAPWLKTRRRTDAGTSLQMLMMMMITTSGSPPPPEIFLEAMLYQARAQCCHATSELPRSSQFPAT